MNYPSPSFKNKKKKGTKRKTKNTINKPVLRGNGHVECSGRGSRSYPWIFIPILNSCVQASAQEIFLSCFTHHFPFFSFFLFLFFALALSLSLSIGKLPNKKKENIVLLFFFFFFAIFISLSGACSLYPREFDSLL